MIGKGVSFLSGSVAVLLLPLSLQKPPGHRRSSSLERQGTGLCAVARGELKLGPGPLSQVNLDDPADHLESTRAAWAITSMLLRECVILREARDRDENSVCLQWMTSFSCGRMPVILALLFMRLRLSRQFSGRLKS